jgi:uncharacterized protein YggU (UPF0235/DUF167 family)
MLKHRAFLADRRIIYNKTMFIKVRTTPKAKKEKIEKVADDYYRMSVKEPAERNLANNRVRRLLATELKVPINQVRQISGHRSKSKVFSIAKR